MKKLLALLALAATLTAVQAEGHDNWLTDLEAAKTKAKTENKAVLMDFAGSDWCPPCKALKKNVLSTKEFETFAKENLVLVDVDFPQNKKLPKKQQEANDALSEKYKVEGFPTVIVITPEGKILGQEVGYDGSDAAAYIKTIKKWLGK